jgi:hypothetical protein
MLPEASYCAKPRPKLGVERWPSDFDVFFQGMEAVGQPDIHIDDHRPGPNGS